MDEEELHSGDEDDTDDEKQGDDGEVKFSSLEIQLKSIKAGGHRTSVVQEDTQQVIKTSRLCIA